MPCLFNTNLAFMRGGTKRWIGKGASRQKPRSPRTEIIYFSCPSFCFVAFVSTVLSFCVRRHVFVYREFACRALYIINRDERTNVSRERLAYPKIIDHTNSREDTWPDLPQYLVISGDLPGTRCHLNPRSKEFRGLVRV